MRQTSRILFVLTFLAMTLGSTGCATVRTMPTLQSYGSPKLYSGMRLDLYAIRDDRPNLDRFSVKAPPHPALDIPFSTILDTLILPMVLPVAMYEYLFE